jgi:hypothetical protein
LLGKLKETNGGGDSSENIKKEADEMEKWNIY